MATASMAVLHTCYMLVHTPETLITINQGLCLADFGLYMDRTQELQGGCMCMWCHALT